MILKIFKILLLLFWMGLIFYFSMDEGYESQEKSHSVVIQVCEFFMGRELTKEEKEIYIEKYDYPIRKVAHFTLYFILGFLFLLNLEGYHHFTNKDYLYLLLFVLFYACLDEFHQLFVSERSGQVLDVFIDTVGGFCSSIYCLIRRKCYEQEKTTS